MRSLYLFVLLLIFQLSANCQKKHFIFTPNYGLENIKFGQPVKHKFIKYYGKYDINYGKLMMGGKKAKIFGKSYTINKYIQYGKDYTFKDSCFYFDTSKMSWYKRYKVDLIIIQVPFKGMSDQGMIIGESTEEDILRLYGKSNDCGNSGCFWYDDLNMGIIVGTDPEEYFIRDGKKINLFGKVKKVTLYKKQD